MGRLLKISDDFQWQSRPSSPYKDASDDSFKGYGALNLLENTVRKPTPISATLVSLAVTRAVNITSTHTW